MRFPKSLTGLLLIPILCAIIFKGSKVIQDELSKDSNIMEDRRSCKKMMGGMITNEKK